MIINKDGNMFDFKHDCYVNTINCQGAMGAGIAKAFRDRMPEMYEHYQEMCRSSLIAPGDCWRYEDVSGPTAHLAVKYSWKHRIRFSWAKMAIRNFVLDIQHKRIKATDIALPRIGSVNGGRGLPFAQAFDNWPDDSEAGYKLLEPFYLSELEKVPYVKFTIYRLT